MIQSILYHEIGYGRAGKRCHDFVQGGQLAPGTISPFLRGCLIKRNPNFTHFSDTCLDGASDTIVTS